MVCEVVGELRQELKPAGIRVIALYPPDFDDVSPLNEDWNRNRDLEANAAMTNREVIEAYSFRLPLPEHVPSLESRWTMPANTSGPAALDAQRIVRFRNWIAASLNHATGASARAKA